MMNYTIDWNNRSIVIAKKGYLKNVMKGGTWEAGQIEDFRKDGFKIKDATRYTVDTIRGNILRNSYWSRYLPSV